MKDFITPTTNCASHIQYPIQESIGYLSPTYRHFLTALTSIDEPKTFKEGSADPRWVEAMKAEISALEENNT